MTPEKMKEVVRASATLIHKLYDQYAKPLDSVCLSEMGFMFDLYHPEDVMGHLLWMCNEIETKLADTDMSKADRWLGFIQGVLWSTSCATIDEMREMNRA